MRIIGFGCFAVAISIIDIRSFRIPNALLVTLLLFLFTVDFLGNRNFMLSGVLAGMAAFSLFFIVRLTTGGLGFGDVKYAGLVGYYLGLECLIKGFLCASLGALFVWLIGFVFFKWTRKTRIPFAPFMSIGACMAGILPYEQNTVLF
jgi:prepilin signal peptidase PulO-like enzyme (type II secretory pathway)